VKFAVAILLLCLPAAAQPLAGVIDIHAHCDPDSTPRSIDALDLARLARERGMRGLVLKNHYEPTASLAFIVRKAVPGIEIFGGIDLNRTVGGINPAAVENMVKVKGGYGRVVWLPTFDAENQVRYSKQNRPFVPVVIGGRVRPEVRQVMAVVARNHMLLETGHSSAEEGLLLLEAARQAGVTHMVVTHAMLAPVLMNVGQMKRAAALGAYIEFVYNALIGPNKSYDFKDYTAAIRAIGPEHCILSSDLGQAGNPVHPDGLEAFLAGMRKEGFSVQEIDLMVKKNPATVLGLP
jgi:hypothetical protein